MELYLHSPLSWYLTKHNFLIMNLIRIISNSNSGYDGQLYSSPFILGVGETEFLDTVAVGGPVVPVPLHR